MKKVFLGWRKLPFQNYIDALEFLGAAVERDEPDACDALLLPGGADIHPRFYGQAIDGAENIDEARDEYELALFRRFAGQGKPILGVCRGLQLVNVALGGTLRQHIDGHDRIDGIDRMHAASTDDAALQSLYGEHFTVNSAHHQAIDRIGGELRVIARAGDGTVEAARHETLPILAVQWHPERLGEAGAALLEMFLKSVSNG